jgi:hypothetical protein
LDESASLSRRSFSEDGRRTSIEEPTGIFIIFAENINRKFHYLETNIASPERFGITTPILLSSRELRIAAHFAQLFCLISPL